MHCTQHTFTMMGKKDRGTVIDLLLKGKSKPQNNPNGYQFYLDIIPPARSTSHSEFMNQIKEIYPSTATWLCLKMTTSTAVSLVAKIQTPKGLILAWRNGWNRGAYNFTIYDVIKKKFYNRANVTASIEFIKIYTTDTKDMPLFINCIDKKNEDFVLKALKNET